MTTNPSPLVCAFVCLSVTVAAALNVAVFFAQDIGTATISSRWPSAASTASGIYSRCATCRATRERQRMMLRQNQNPTGSADAPPGSGNEGGPLPDAILMAGPFRHA